MGVRFDPDKTAEGGASAVAQVVYTARKSRRLFATANSSFGESIQRAEVLDHGHFRQFVCNQEQMRKHGRVLAVQPMENFNRQLDFNATGDVKKCARGNQCLMQRRELGRAKNGGLRHEMFPEQLGVFNHGALERLKDNAALFQLIRNHVALNELVACEGHAASDLIEPARLL